MATIRNYMSRAPVLAFFVLLAPSVFAAADDSPRERVSFDNDWRFTRDDPADAGGQLAYAKVKDAVKAMGADVDKAPADQEPLPAAISGTPGRLFPTRRLRLMTAAGGRWIFRTTGASRGRSSRSISAGRASCRTGAWGGIGSISIHRLRTRASGFS